MSPLATLALQLGGGLALVSLTIVATAYTVNFIASIGRAAA